MNSKLEEKLIEYEKKSPITDERELLQAVKAVLEVESKKTEKDTDLIDEAVDMILKLCGADTDRLALDADDLTAEILNRSRRDAEIIKYRRPKVKKHKRIILAAAAALFAVTAAMSIYAAYNSFYEETPAPSEETEPIEVPAPSAEKVGERYDREVFDVREGAEEIKILVSDNGNKYNLRYAYTRDLYNGRYRDIFVDLDLNEYIYDENGNYVGYFSNTNGSIFEALPEFSEDETKTEEVIVALAEKHAREMYGSRFDGMELTDFMDKGYEYIIEFARLYGKGGFAEGAGCHMVIGNEGNVINSGMFDGEKYDGFDSSLCEDVTGVEVTSFAVAEAFKRFSQYNIEKTEILGIEARVMDGKSVFVVSVCIYSESWPSKEDVEEYNLAIAHSIDPIFGWDCVYELES